MRDDARALRLVQQWGRTATAFHVLSPGLWHWVLFDIVLYVALGYARRHASLAALRVSAVAVSIDTLLTFCQALVWNAPRVASWFEATLVALACTGPLLAAVVLWGAVRRRHRMVDP